MNLVQFIRFLNQSHGPGVPNLYFLIYIMKKIYIPLAALAAALPAAAGIYDAPGRTVTVLNSDTVNSARVEKHFKENAPASPKNSTLPRFAIVGKDHKFYIGLSAQFLGEGVVDFGDEMPSAINFIPADLQPAPRGNRSSLGFGWQTSSVSLNVLAMPGTDNQLGLFFKANFTGGNGNFNVSHAYVRYRGLTAGYNSSQFNDGAATPVTIDNQGPNGYPDISLFTVSWTQRFSDHWSASVGLDAPSVSLSTGATTQEVNQRIPSFPVYVQYGWQGGNSHVRLSGLIRPMQYRNLVGDSNKALTGLGVQLSGIMTVVGPLSVNYSAAYGRGIANYLQDDNGLGVDAVAVETPGELQMTRNLGLTAGISFAITPRLTANASYSHLTNFLPDATVGQTGQYKYGDYVAANLIYNVNKFLTAGIEYDYGHRKTFDSNSLHANRLQLHLAVTF